MQGLELLKDELFQLFVLHMHEVDVVLFAIGAQFIQIHLVTLDGVR